MAKSNYDGYVGRTKKRKAESASEAFNRNYEGMKSAYETYKKSSDPDSSKMEKDLKRGSERAAETVQRTGRDSDNERTRESRRTGGDRPPMSKKWTE